MRLDYEVVHLVDGRLFDAESYELTSVPRAVSQHVGGYYVMLRTPGHESHNDAAPGLVGPFASARHATLAARDLQLLSSAGTQPDGSLAAATVPTDKEKIS
jgi:hypothetical protein